VGWPVPHKGFRCCQPLCISCSPLAPGEALRGGRISSPRSALWASPHGQLLAPCHASLAPLTSHRPPALPPHTKVSGEGALGIPVPGRGLQRHYGREVCSLYISRERVQSSQAKTWQLSATKLHSPAPASSRSVGSATRLGTSPGSLLFFCPQTSEQYHALTSRSPTGLGFY